MTINTTDAAIKNEIELDNFLSDLIEQEIFTYPFPYDDRDEESGESHKNPAPSLAFYQSV